MITKRDFLYLFLAVGLGLGIGFGGRAIYKNRASAAINKISLPSTQTITGEIFKEGDFYKIRSDNDIAYLQANSPSLEISKYLGNTVTLTGFVQQVEISGKQEYLVNILAISKVK